MLRRKEAPFRESGKENSCVINNTYIHQLQELADAVNRYLNGLLDDATLAVVFDHNFNTLRDPIGMQWSSSSIHA